MDDPKGRYRHGIANDDKYIFILGGGTSTMAYDLDELPAFSLELHKWEHIRTEPDPLAPVPGYPGSRKCHSCVQYTTDCGDVEVIITGGYYEDMQFFNDIWKLNLRTLRWQLFQTARLPYPVYFHDAATSGNGLMYVFGGIEVRDTDMLTATRTNEMYKIWVTLPKLSEICWEAMLRYHPTLPAWGRDRICEMGVPQKFANRIDRSMYISDGGEDDDDDDDGDDDDNAE